MYENPTLLVAGFRVSFPWKVRRPNRLPRAIPGVHFSHLHPPQDLYKEGYCITTESPGMHLSFPRLPPKPSYPPPLIGEEAMDPYIIPLYLQSWIINPKCLYISDSYHTWPGFIRIYNMNDIATARQFFDEIVEIAMKEQVLLDPLNDLMSVLICILVYYSIIYMGLV